MAGKRARRIAGELADAHLARTGVTKSAGQRDELVKAFMPLAEGVAVIEKAAKRLAVRDREQREHQAWLERMADQIADQVRTIQALNAADASPVPRGWRPFSPEEDVVGLVGRQQAPKVNGHHYVDPVGRSDAPAGHPEAGE